MRFLVLTIIGLVVLAATGPTLIDLSRAAVTLVLACGLVTVLVRLASHFLGR